MGKRIGAVLLGSLCAALWNPFLVRAESEPPQLYARSAVLMDGNSGRVLFEKEGGVKRPMASTTKVMTCILALENARGDDIVRASARAAAQPDVQLHLREGERFYLEDLLYSLMLKSHNDTAVAIAEHIGGSVEGFARMMNEKAEKLGCGDTHFVTPNGLDAKDDGGVHATTAADLARIMRYAVRNETFLKITQTREYSFWDLDHKRQFQVGNANAFLDMMDGALSGKTGFTADAGYCYVGALQRGERQFIIALLGCGWPNHKTYKWQDARALFGYGLENYEPVTIRQEKKLPKLPVEDGILPDKTLFEEPEALLSADGAADEKSRRILLKKGERVECRLCLPKKLRAPVKKGQTAGWILYTLNGRVLWKDPIRVQNAVGRINFLWCAEAVFRRYFLK